MSQSPTQKEHWSGKVGGEWASLADRIDFMLRPMTEAAFARAAFQPGERVIDIGCGAGATSLEIARRVAPGGSALGVDLSPPLLEVARERASKARLAATFVEDDAGAAVFDEKFDAAFSRFGVMFFESPAPAFAHLRAQLREGGRIVFVCWRSLAENVWATTPIEAILPMLRAPPTPPDPDAPGPFAFADGAKVERILNEAGWREIDLSRWDGDIAVGGGGKLEESADFMLRIGPCARALADHALDPAEARRRVMEKLAPMRTATGVMLPAACWIASARA